MNEKTKAILVGLILGDGCLTPLTGNSNRSRLDMKGDDKNLSYLRWLHKKLQSVGVSSLKPKKNYHQHRFYTKTTKEIGELRKLFYPHGHKVVPQEIKGLLKSPIT